MNAQSDIQEAKKVFGSRVIHSTVKRPPKGAAVMLRYPAKDGGVLILADTEEELFTKVVRRMKRENKLGGKSN
jgi:hypothetical protein